MKIPGVEPCRGLVSREVLERNDLEREVERLRAENEALKVRIHRSNLLLDKCECWLDMLGQVNVWAWEPGWRPFKKRFDATLKEVREVKDWWSWGEPW